MRTRHRVKDHFGISRAEVQPSEPIEFVRAGGRKPHDMIGTTRAALKLVSDRFLEVLREHGFSGWATFPARVVLDGEHELGGYHGFAVAGRCGPIDDRLSEEVTLPPPVPEGRPTPGLRGLCFQPETWDGSDFFASEAGGAMIFVVERVKDAFEHAGLTNVAFERLTEIERLWRADGSFVDEG